MRGHTLSKDHNNWCCGSKKPQIRLTALKLCRMTKQTHSIHTVDWSCCFCCTWADKVPKDWKQKLGGSTNTEPHQKWGPLTPSPSILIWFSFLHKSKPHLWTGLCPISYSGMWYVFGSFHPWF